MRFYSILGAVCLLAPISQASPISPVDSTVTAVRSISFAFYAVVLLFKSP